MCDFQERLLVIYFILFYFFIILIAKIKKHTNARKQFMHIIIISQ